MQLHFDDLYNVLTDQSLIATDRICSLLSQNQDSHWYDQFFQTNVNALKPIVMCDHEIGIEARQKLIFGVVERMGLGDDILQHVGEIFAQFVRKASLEFHNTFENIHENQLWAHIHNVNANTEPSFYYDLLSDLTGLKRAFEVLVQTEHKLTLHSIKTQNEKKQWPAVGSTASKDEAMKRIVERIEYANISCLDQTRKALDILKDHPNFLSFVNHLLSVQNTGYAKHTQQGFELFNFENQLPTHLKKTIQRVHAETLELLNEFQSKQVSLMSQMWADKVAQRCQTLLGHMQNAPDDICSTMVVNKSSIEERRSKEDGHTVHVAGLKS